jgi:hypothetical protein
MKTATYKTISLDLRWWDTSGISTGKAPCSSDATALQCGSAFADMVKYSF